MYFQDMNDAQAPQVIANIGEFKLEMPKGSAMIEFEPIAKKVKVIHENL